MQNLPADIIFEVCQFLDASDLHSFLATSAKLWNLRHEKWFSTRIDPYSKAIERQDWIYGLGEAMQRSNAPQTNFFMDKFISECNELSINDMCTTLRHLNHVDGNDQFKLNIWTFAVISATHNKHSTLMEYSLQMSGGLHDAKFAPRDFEWSNYNHCKSTNDPLYFYQAIHWDCMKEAIKQSKTGWLSWLLKMDKRAKVPFADSQMTLTKNIVQYVAKNHVTSVLRDDWIDCSQAQGLLSELLQPRLQYLYWDSDPFWECPCCAWYWYPDYTEDFNRTDSRKIQAEKKHRDYTKTRQRKKHENCKRNNRSKKDEEVNRGGKVHKWNSWKKEEQEILHEALIEV